MPSDSRPRHPSPNYRRFVFLLAVGLADGLLVLAYCPALAYSLESLVLVDPYPLPLPPPPQARDLDYEMPGLDKPDTLSADEAALDDDTLVIGVYAAGRARAYLVEAFEHGPKSHIVNDLLGGVPISVTHCDISRCTRVFTGGTLGQPLALSLGGRKNGRLILKFDGHLYRQETSEPLKDGAATFSYREYRAELTEWKSWRRSHPETDVYMGAVEEATPPEAAEPRRLTQSKLHSPTPPSS